MLNDMLFARVRLLKMIDPLTVADAPLSVNVLVLALKVPLLEKLPLAEWL
jgi:hypothetical protein